VVAPTQHFLYHRAESMDLVDKQYVSRLEIGQQRRHIAGFFQHRTGGVAYVHTHFVADDIGQGSFPQARRAKYQHVIERLPARARRGNKHLHLFVDSGLPSVIRQ